MFERLHNLKNIDATKIASFITKGTEVILQYSDPIYNTDLLKVINTLCEKYGNLLNVRFYDHRISGFDFRILKEIPSVTNLEITIDGSYSNIEELWSLRHLKRLRLGIDHMARFDILSGDN